MAAEIPTDAESSDETDSSFDSEIDSDESFSDNAVSGTASSNLFRLFLSQIPSDDVVLVPVRNPQQLWEEFLNEISLSRCKIFKITDVCSERYAIENMGQIDVVTSQLLRAISSARGITHVIIGNLVLRLLKENGNQKSLLSTIVTYHHESLTYIKLGSDDFNDSAHFGLDVSAILDPLNEYRFKIKLNEFEIRGLEIRNQADIDCISDILMGGKDSIRQLNLLGVETASAGRISFDPILAAARQATCLDELRLERIGNFAQENLISMESLKSLLLVKKKWWRLGLCGMGLTDSHCYSMAHLFSRDNDCKVGDLLSLRNNPSISQVGYTDIFKVFFNKQRMGLIKVDDLEWEKKFDLVRSMNNLHGRLQFVEEGCFENRGKWVSWLAKLGNLSWEDEKHKVNYLLFTLLEKPDFVKGI